MANRPEPQPIGAHQGETGLVGPALLVGEDPPAWRVVEGGVDVFSERQRRRHVARFSSGALLFGLPSTPAGRTCLVAVVLPDTVVEPVAAAQLAQFLSTPSGRAAARAWVSALRSATNSAGEGLPGSGLDWRVWLRSFHIGILALLEGAHAAKEEAILARVASRQRREASRLDQIESGFADLPEHDSGEGAEVAEAPPRDTNRAASVRGATAQAPVQRSESGDRLLDACRHALASIGVTLEVPVGLDESAEPRDRIEAIARAAGARVRSVRVPRHSWTPEVEAFVAFQRGGPSPVPVALAPGARVGRRMARDLEPVAWCFSRPLPPRALRLRDLWSFLAKGASRIGLELGAVWLAAGALGFLAPALTAWFIDDVVPAAPRGALLASVLVLAIATSSLLVFDLGAAVLRVRLQARLGRALGAGIMDRLLSLPAAFFRRYSVGDLITRAGLADTEHELLLMSALSGALAALFSASSLAALFWFDVRLGLTSLGAGSLVLAASGWFFSVNTRLERALLSNATRLRSFLLQLFGAISAVRTAGAETWLFSRWAELFRRRRTLELASSRLGARVAVVHEVVPVACAGAFFWVLQSTVGGSLASSGGRYLASLQAFAVFLGGMLRLGSALTDVTRAVPLLERAEPILSALPEHAQRGRKPGKLSGRVELRQVSFRYAADGPLVLEDVDARIEPGQFVALVGASGSGKSTVVRLLLGFERPGAGAILYDGQPLSGLDVLEVRRQIGTVLQHDQLTTGSVYENISAVRPMSLEQAWEAARLAGLERELNEWPMGMHSLITQGARAFSGGERQRIMIARALAGGPRLLVLDEATSALDNQVQAEVMRNLAAMSVTRIVVAHRLSTIQGADLILVFERGRIVERGDYASLLARGGVLARLVRRQSL